MRILLVCDIVEWCARDLIAAKSGLMNVRLEIMYLCCFISLLESLPELDFDLFQG